MSRIRDLVPFLLRQLVQAIHKSRRSSNPAPDQAGDREPIFAQPAAVQVTQPDRLRSAQCLFSVQGRMRSYVSFRTNPEKRLGIFGIRFQQPSLVVGVAL
jgi:hypothetical protein